MFFYHKSTPVFLTKQARYLLRILPEYGLPGYEGIAIVAEGNSCYVGRFGTFLRGGGCGHVWYIMRLNWISMSVANGSLWREQMYVYMLHIYAAYTVHIYA